MTLITNLIPWSTLAQALNISGSHSLPTCLLCPECNQHCLFVYAQAAGEWFHCDSCRRCGDLVDLAALLWQIDRQEAMTRICDPAMSITVEPFSVKDLEAYEEDRTKRTAVDTFWRDCRQHLNRANDVGVKRLLNRLGNCRQLTTERWAGNPGKLLGSTTLARIRKFWGPTTLSRNGRGWGDSTLLTLPYETAPGRLSGFVFLGREGRPDVDMFFKSVQTKYDPGLFGLSTIHDSKAAFGARVLAMRDPFEACGLQIKNAHTSLSPLPIVAWWDGPKFRTKCWDALKGVTPVFWGPMTGAMLAQAMQADGLISIRTPEEAVEYRAAPRDLLRHLFLKARPWEQVLDKWLETPEGKAGTGLLIQELRARNIPVKPLLDKVTHYVEPRKLVTVGQSVFAEDGRGWHRTSFKLTRLFSSCIVRIDQVVTGRFPRYVGRLLIAGEEIPFDIRAKSLEINAIPYVVDACLRAGKPRPVLDPSFNRLAVPVAMAYQTPETVHNAVSTSRHRG